MDGNIKDTPPTVLVPRLEDRPRWQALEKEMAEVQQQSEARRKVARTAFDRWAAQARPDQILATVPHTGLRFPAGICWPRGRALTSSCWRTANSESRCG